LLEREILKLSQTTSDSDLKAQNSNKDLQGYLAVSSFHFAVKLQKGRSLSQLP